MTIKHVDDAERGNYLGLGGAAPRWYFPRIGMRSANALKAWRPYGRFSSLQWKAVLAASRLGVLHRLPVVTHCVVDFAISWRSLGWTGTKDPIPFVYLSRHGKSHKAVVHLVDSETSKLALLVKVPLTEDTANRVRYEARMLRELASEGRSDVPRVCSDLGTIGIASQYPVEGVLIPNRLTPAVVALSRSFQNKNERRSLAGWVEKIFSDHAASPLAAELRSHCDHLPDDTLLPGGWFHGDFAPWNILRQNNGRLVAIDWEFAVRDSFWGLDLAHFVSYQAFLLSENDSQKFRIALRAGLEKLASLVKSDGYTRPLLEKIWTYYSVDYLLRMESASIVNAYAELLLAVLRKKEKIT